MRRRRMATLLGTVGLALSLTAPTAAGAQSPGAPQGSRYDHVVQRDDPVGYWPQQADSGRMVRDLTRRSPDGIVHGSPRVETMPNGDKTLVFDGDEDYVEIADADTLSTATTGEITVEAWLRPDVLTFRKTRSSGYVHWMGKGEDGRHEWVSRIYSADNTVGRENRISGYQFNLDGGLGAGSYYQEPLVPGQWLHYVLVVNANHSSEDYPAGYTKLYIDGELSDQDSLIYDGTEMVPGNGTAPMRIGTRQLETFFEGAIGKVALYDHELTPADVVRHYDAMHS
ncbi:LamG domain-containing protein [Saccharomonospora azurea]|uniref:LamG domain-containing protein n=1 Tax=Saccharomonospora azurea TaxID=40988 RepID=UPI003D8EA4FC